jgi:hypothetical protein
MLFQNFLFPSELLHDGESFGIIQERLYLSIKLEPTAVKYNLLTLRGFEPLC